MADKLLLSILPHAAIRIVTAVTTEVGAEAARRHGAVGGAAVALSRASTAGLCLATLTKGGERVTIQVLGDGPLGSVVADATDSGEVRAYLGHPEVMLSGCRPDERCSIAEGIGRSGMLNVIRDLGLRERFSGQAPLVSGEVDEDVEEYLTRSEQITSAFGCEAVLGPELGIGAAGGVLAQCLPGDSLAATAAASIIASARARLRSGVLHAALASGAAGPMDLLRAALGPDADGVRVLEERDVRFRCPCSRERVHHMLLILEERDLRGLIDEDGGAEIVCNFCRERYLVGRAELEAVLARRHGKPN